MNSPDLTFRSLEKHCYNDGNCHCDWRVSVQDCVESTIMWHVHLWNVILSLLAVVIGGSLLFYRVFIKGHSIWSNRGISRGLMRPTPIDCMVLCFTMFNSIRTVTSLILVLDVDPENMLARSFMFELPWIFGLSGLLSYFIGISQAIGQSSTASGWLPSALIIDIFGFSAVIIPFLCSWGFTFTLGALAKTNLDMAELLMSINYGLWALWTGGTGTIIFLAGVRLVRILEAHHRRNRHSSSYADIKAGIFKIRMMAAILAICLWSFGALLLMYAILRYQILRTVPASILIGVLWNFMAVVTTILAYLLVIFDPKKGPNAALNSRSRSGGDENTNECTTTPGSTNLEVKFNNSVLSGTNSRIGDSDAIMNALKKIPNLEIEENKSNNNGKKLFSGSKKTKKWSESTSSFSSNMELTSYEVPR